MSIQCSIAKRYVRLVFREEGEFDPLKTQRQFNRPEPPRGTPGRQWRFPPSSNYESKMPLFQEP